MESWDRTNFAPGARLVRTWTLNGPVYYLALNVQTVVTTIVTVWSALYHFSQACRAAYFCAWGETKDAITVRVHWITCQGVRFCSVSEPMREGTGCYLYNLWTTTFSVQVYTINYNQGDRGGTRTTGGGRLTVLTCYSWLNTRLGFPHFQVQFGPLHFLLWFRVCLKIVYF